VTGGKPLKGEVTPVPNKNSILACLPACILTDEDVYYHNVPKSTDVEKMLEMLKLLGAMIDDSDYNNVKINCSKLISYKVDKEMGSLIRASIMFAGPCWHVLGYARFRYPAVVFLVGDRFLPTLILFPRWELRWILWTMGTYVLPHPKMSLKNILFGSLKPVLREQRIS